MDKILVLDFGGQYSHLIARRVRSLGYYSEIASPMNDDFQDVKGIILSGGPSSVYDKAAPDYNKYVFTLGIPMLGICYGMQLMAQNMDGKVRPLDKKEYGKAVLSVGKSPLFQGLSEEEPVWMSHGDSIDEVPEGFQVIGTTQNCPVAAMQKNNIFGIQFHPEVTHTEKGMQVLDNFLSCTGMKKNWTADDYIELAINDIKETVGDGHVLMAASGGVDSTVASVLLHRALGEKIYCVFVDTGLVRKYEVEDTKRIFEREGLKNLIIVDAADQFISLLKGITEPEEKRKVISETFFNVFQDKAAELSEQYKIEFLGQGTIYPDRIETAQPSDNADKIKSHHNVLLPDWLHLKLVEPLKDFYKDEVRELGLKLGIDKEAIIKHPFPGPGLGVRILGELTPEKISLYQHIDVIVDKMIRKAGWYDALWMSFPVLVPVQEFESAEEHGDIVGEVNKERERIVADANKLLKEMLPGDYDEARAILLPVKSVGVMGDSRTYEQPLCLRIVKYDLAFEIEYELMENISNELINQVKGVNRVIWDITDKPNGWENLIVLRAITSKDAMTSDWAKLEFKLLRKIADAIMETGVSRVAYDITQKPPGTMEWE
ncbi:glutamine-hydrolyzing GMP synthase [Nanoarchaeota archaeon]